MNKHIKLLFIVCVLLLTGNPAAFAQQIPIVPDFGLGSDEGPAPQDVTITLQLFFLFTILSLLPSIAVMTTCFIRISIVLVFVRRAIGTQQTRSFKKFMIQRYNLTSIRKSQVYNLETKTPLAELLMKRSPLFMSCFIRRLYPYGNSCGSKLV